MDGNFGFELGDAPTGRDQFGVLAAGPAGQLPGIDQMLTAPDIDRLLADGQVDGDLSTRATRGDEIKDLAAELGGIPLRHGTGDPLGLEDRDHPHQSLHETQDRSSEARDSQGNAHVAARACVGTGSPAAW
jgi:hypothetical protein